MSLIQAGNTVGGLEALKAVLHKGTLQTSMLGDVQSNVGTALAVLGRHNEALKAYKVALATGTASRPHYNIAVSLVELGRITEAETHYRLAAKLDVQAESAYTNLGNLLVDRGRRPEALACYRAGVAANPQHAASYNNLANLERDGASDAALRRAGRMYTTAIRLDPTYVEAYRNLANLLKEREAWLPRCVPHALAYTIQCAVSTLPPCACTVARLQRVASSRGA